MTTQLTSRDEVARVGARVRAVVRADAGTSAPGVVIGLSKYAPVALVRFDDDGLRYVPLRRLMLDVPVTVAPVVKARARSARQIAKPGGHPLYWTKERVIEAVKAWHAEHGKAPTSDEWTRAAPEHPSRRTVDRRFGTWNAGMLASGMPALPVGRPRKKT